MIACPKLTIETDRLGPTPVAEVADFDIGTPEVREVLRNRPSADGTIDRTLFIGARPITATARFGNAAALNGFMAYGHPRHRATLTVTDWSIWPTVQIGVRSAGFTPLVDAALHRSGVVVVTAQWIAGSGVFTGTTLHTETVRPAGIGAPSGRTYNEVHNRFYGWAPPAGEVELFNAGSTDAWPVLTIHGPIVDPKAIHLDTGEFIQFDGLTINEGEFITVDMAARTAYANGDPTDSVLQFVDLTTSRWWNLAPGVNRVRLLTFSASDPAQMFVTWRDTYL